MKTFKPPKPMTEPECLCGFCGLPDADKYPHPIRWPGEESAGTELVRAVCRCLTTSRRTYNMKARKPTKPGAAFGGGFYAGRFFIGNQPYASIVAPKSEGQIEPMPWIKSQKSAPGAASYCNGMANTKAMAKAGSALAKRILKLRIGGFDDWHLPSRLQLLLTHHELAGVEGFEPGGGEAFEPAWYWSSTYWPSMHWRAEGWTSADLASTWRNGAWRSEGDGAWMHDFGSGNQGCYRKDSLWSARAVRVIKL